MWAPLQLLQGARMSNRTFRSLSKLAPSTLAKPQSVIFILLLTSFALQLASRDGIFFYTHSPRLNNCLL